MDRRKTSNSNQTSRKRRRKLSSSQEKDELTNAAYHSDGNNTQTTSITLSATAHATARQWNVIDRVLDASKYDKAPANVSSLGLYELCRDWIYAGTTLNETIRLAENASQEKAKLHALNASHEDEKSSPNDKSKSKLFENI